MALFLDVPVGDALMIEEGRIMIRVQQKKGQTVRLEIDADRSIPIEVAPKERPKAPWAKGLTGGNKGGSQE